MVGGVFSYFNWAEDYSFGSECAYSNSKGGIEENFAYNDACNTTNVMYDTTTMQIGQKLEVLSVWSRLGALLTAAFTPERGRHTDERFGPGLLHHS